MIAENLEIMFADFGVSVTWDAQGLSSLGILDTPDELVGNGIALSTEYLLTVVTEDFPGLVDGDSLVVDGETYEVRQVRKFDDGKLTRVLLQKP